MDGRDLLLYSLNVTHTRIQRCVDDVTEDEARSLPEGLTPIVWQVGHMAVVDLNFARRADGTSAAPDGYQDLFKAGTGGEAAYPDLGEVKATMDRAQQALEAIARSADPAKSLDHQRFGNVGEMILFCCYHRGYHIGKMTTLRALLKKARLFG